MLKVFLDFFSFVELNAFVVASDDFLEFSQILLLCLFFISDFNLAYEYWCKNTQQNSCKLNLRTHQNLYLPWLSRLQPKSCLLFICTISLLLCLYMCSELLIFPRLLTWIGVTFYKKVQCQTVLVKNSTRP